MGEHWHFSVKELIDAGIRILKKIFGAKDALGRIDLFKSIVTNKNSLIWKGKCGSKRLRERLTCRKSSNFKLQSIPNEIWLNVPLYLKNFIKWTNFFYVWRVSKIYKIIFLSSFRRWDVQIKVVSLWKFSRKIYITISNLMSVCTSVASLASRRVPPPVGLASPLSGNPNSLLSQIFFFV